jgi:hypothetical protein
MNLRWHLCVRGGANAALAVFAVGLLLFVPTDSSGRWIAIGLGALFALVAYGNFKAAFSARDEEQAFAPPLDATASEQVNFFKRLLWVTVLVFPVITVLNVQALNTLEKGERASIWVPVAVLYDFGGYWPAILSVPVLGALCCTIFLWKIAKIKKGEPKIAGPTE